ADPLPGRYGATFSGCVNEVRKRHPNIAFSAVIDRRYIREMKIVITGSGGRLGAALTREYASKFDVNGFNHSQLDLADPQKIRDTLSPLDFDLLVNAAAFTNVDLAEKETEQAFKVNAEAPRVLAEICEAKGACFVHFTPDSAFDAQKAQPYSQE